MYSCTAKQDIKLGVLAVQIDKNKPKDWIKLVTLTGNIVQSTNDTYQQYHDDSIR